MGDYEPMFLSHDMTLVLGVPKAQDKVDQGNKAEKPKEEEGNAI